MEPQDIRYENEFEQEVPAKAVQEFNTLQTFSVQPTSLLETTLTDTLGLSMHNAVTNQQQSQMTTAASITNACARLLKTHSVVAKPKPKAEEKASANEDHTKEASAAAQDTSPPEDPPAKKKALNVKGFLKAKKGAEDEQTQPNEL
ncbi:RebB family R body protein [Marinomonas sp. THO17]|uniref:RebB family R body protein n=1 Tax=Marinomonas sp. THO17 TaxID=3149048 RepID=UPI00336BDF22